MADSWQTLAFFAAICVAGYFLMIRPQRKRAQEAKEAAAALSSGDRVMTIGGIIGTIVELGDKEVILEVNPDTQLTVLRGALATTPPPEPEFDFVDDTGDGAAMFDSDTPATEAETSTKDEL